MRGDPAILVVLSQATQVFVPVIVPGELPDAAGVPSKPIRFRFECHRGNRLPIRP